MSLFSKLKPRGEQEIAPIEELETPATETPDVPEIRDIEAALAEGQTFADGEIGEFLGERYQSRTNNNAWTPRQHPAVWMRV